MGILVLFVNISTQPNTQVLRHLLKRNLHLGAFDMPYDVLERASETCYSHLLNKYVFLAFECLHVFCVISLNSARPRQASLKCAKFY